MLASKRNLSMTIANFAISVTFRSNELQRLDRENSCLGEMIYHEPTHRKICCRYYLCRSFKL